MATGVPSKTAIDKRLWYVEDDAVNRKIRIKLDAQSLVEMAPQWQQKQQQLYPSSQLIVPLQDLGKVITDEVNMDTERVGVNAMSNLLSITHSPAIAEYILSQLSEEEMVYLNNFFPAIQTELKRKAGKRGIDKDVAVNAIKSMVANDRTFNWADIEQAAELSQQDKHNARLQMAGEEEQRMLDHSQALHDEQMQSNQDQLDNHAKYNEAQDFIKQQQFDERMRQPIASRKINRIIMDQTVRTRRQKRLQASEDAVALMTNRKANRDDDDFDDSGSSPLKPMQLVVNSDHLTPERHRRKEMKLYKSQIEGLSFTDLEVEAIFNDVECYHKNGRARSIKSIITDLLIQHGNSYDAHNATIFGTASPPASPPASALASSSRPASPTFGTGLRRIVYGKGYTAPVKSSLRHYLGSNQKYYIDLKRFKESVLMVKYSTSDSCVKALGSQRISSDVKVVVEDIMKQSFSPERFAKLNKPEQRVVKRLIQVTKLDVNTGDDEDDDEFDKQYQILLGEINSGNDSPVIKKQLKGFVLTAILENRIPKAQGQLLLYQLSL